jgi:hypothetical protein
LALAAYDATKSYPLKEAADIVKNRNEYLDMRSNSLERRKHKTLTDETGADEEIVTVIPE